MQQHITWLKFIIKDNIYWDKTKRIMYQSRRFKSSLFTSDDSFGNLSMRKLPGQVKSIASSGMKGVQVIPNPALASLNRATVEDPSALGLRTSEWGCTPSDRVVKELKGNPIVVIIVLWDWNLLAAPLSLLCAFWWPPRACELKNFLMQKLHEKTLLLAGFDWESECPTVKDSFLLRPKLNHSPKLSSPAVTSSLSLVLDSVSWLLFCILSASSSLCKVIAATLQSNWKINGEIYGTEAWISGFLLLNRDNPRWKLMANKRGI